MRTWTLEVVFWIRLRRSRAMSSVMPALRRTSIWPRPLPTVFGSPALKSLGESLRRAAFSRRTWSAALARSSLADSMRMVLSRRSSIVEVSLKSNRVATSRRAWSSALVSSAGSNSETTSNENSAIDEVEDGVQANHHRRDRKRESDERGERQDGADSRRAFVERLERRLVVGVGSVIEVIHPCGMRALDQRVQDWLPPGRQGFCTQVGDR